MLNIEEPDEKPQNAAFHQALPCCKDKYILQEKTYQYITNFEILTCYSLNYVMNDPTVSIASVKDLISPSVKSHANNSLRHGIYPATEPPVSAMGFLLINLGLGLAKNVYVIGPGLECMCMVGTKHCSRTVNKTIKQFRYDDMVAGHGLGWA